MGFILAAGIDNEKPEECAIIEKLGLIPGHCYGINDARDLKDKNGNDVKLVKLRNPWGNFEWKGTWSDDADDWTEELKKEVNLSNVDDGMFWMTFEDFCKYFTYFQVCHYRDGFEFEG
jgi:calpain-15